MKSDERKIIAMVAGIIGLVGLVLAVVALFTRRKDLLVSLTVVALIVSSAMYAIAVIDGYNNQGDFNAAIRLAAPGASDDEYRCANNIVAASVLDLLSEPGLNNVYNWAVDQAKNGAKCDEGVLDDHGLCTGAAETCKDGLAKKSECPSGCKYTSLKDGIKALLVALLQRVGPAGGKPAPLGPGPVVPPAPKFSMY